MLIIICQHNYLFSFNWVWICAIQREREIRIKSFKWGKTEPFTKKVLLKGSW